MDCTAASRNASKSSRRGGRDWQNETQTESVTAQARTTFYFERSSCDTETRRILCLLIEFRPKG